MNIPTEDLPVFVQEMRDLLGSINGCKGRINETISLSYVVVVDTDEQKEGVEKIAEVLTTQATNYAIDLEIVPALQSEIDEAREALLQNQLRAKGSFEV
jgi:hypothetical protein